MAIDRIVGKSPIDEGNYFIDNEGAPGNERFYLDIPAGEFIQVDFKRNTLETEAFDALKTIGEDISVTDRQYIVGFNQELVKEGCISYDAQGRYIENLFSQINGFLGFSNNIYHLRSAINSNVFYSLKKNDWDRLVDNYLKNASDTTPASVEDKEFIKSMTVEEIWDRLSEDAPNFFIDTDTEDIQVRLRYRPKRDIDFITERYSKGNMNKATVISNQRDSFIDIGRYIENNYVLSNRIGNVINGVRQSFDTWGERWKLGDYVGEWIVINVKWRPDDNYVICDADLAKGFANTQREYALSRQPSAYVFTGKALQSNFIFRQYLELFKNDAIGDDTLLTNKAKRTILNIFDFDNAYNEALTNANILNNNTGEYIDAPLVNIGRGNTMVWHFSFNSAQIAGNAMLKTNQSGRGTYAWYRDPVLYTDSDFKVDKLRFNLVSQVDYKEDTSTRKYYPIVNHGNDDYWEREDFPVDKDPNASLAFTNELIVYSEDRDIIIGNAFTKYNNLIREFDTTPSLTLYSSDRPYTILDKFVRDSDILVSGGQITLETTPYKLIVLDSLDQSIEYWALAYNNEIVIAGNNNVSEISFRFLKTPSDEYVIGVFSGSADLAVDMSLVTSFIEAFIAEETNLSIDMTLVSELLVPFIFNGNQNFNAQLNLLSELIEPTIFNGEQDLNVDLSLATQFIEPYVLNGTQEFNADMELITQIILPINISSVNRVLNTSLSLNTTTVIKGWEYVSTSGTEPTTSGYIDGGIDNTISTSNDLPVESANNYDYGDFVYYRNTNSNLWFVYKVIEETI
jgi:hypothetical protein